MWVFAWREWDAGDLAARRTTEQKQSSCIAGNIKSDQMRDSFFRRLPTNWDGVNLKMSFGLETRLETVEFN
jgi:hypothetical protein